MKTSDILSLSLRSLRGNPLRSGITIAIIALGISALVGIVTAIQAMNQKLTESFSTMGANAFTLRQKERGFRVGSGRREMEVRRKGLRIEKKSSLGQPVTLQQAELFREIFHYPAKVSFSGFAGNRFAVSSNTKRTSPNVYVFGVDENYTELNGDEIKVGRPFSKSEIKERSGMCVLGFDVAQKLFGDNVSNAIGKLVRFQYETYQVIAVLESRGSVFGFSRDNLVLIGYKRMVQQFGSVPFSVGIKAPQLTRVEEAMAEAEGAFRTVRQLPVREENNFVLERSNSIAEKAINSLRYIRIAVLLIGLITLIGAAIGLMNIMLVAVAERTKEVGLLKAIGAPKKSIYLQFICEAVLISLAGAIIGIAMGIALGNVFGLFLKTEFVVPWNWTLYGVFICTVVGLSAGSYPAWKAGNLNPMEALRYE